jgi:tetratricopeptide (TPR) repeat protein
MDCLMELVESLRCDEQFAEAERAVKDALKHAEAYKEKVPRLFCTLGLILQSSNRPVEACEAFHRALIEVNVQSYQPDKLTIRQEAYWHLGALYYELRDYDKAIGVLEKLLSLCPEDDLYRRNVLMSLGKSYHEAGNSSKARICYEKVLNSPLASENEKASTRQGLGVMYYDLGKYDEATAMFQSAVDHFTWEVPFYGDTLLWLGNCYYAKGDYGKAADCYNKVAVLPYASERDRKSAQEYMALLPESFKRTLQ